jgi:hypothetical protein
MSDSIKRLKKKRRIIFLKLIVFGRKLLAAFLVSTIGLISLIVLIPLWIFGFFMLMLFDIVITFKRICLLLPKWKMSIGSIFF